MRPLLFLLVLPLWGQVQARLPFRGPAPAARPAPLPRYRGGFGLGYWGGGYWGSPSVISMPAPAPPEPKAPVLVSSSLYQPDRAQPVLREYGALPVAVAASSTAAVVAFRDGRVEPVLAYWVSGNEF